MKVFLDKNRITAVLDGGDTLSFAVGTGVIDWKNNDLYASLKGSVKADAILDKLYVSAESPEDMLTYLCGKPFSVSLEMFEDRVLPAFPSGGRGRSVPGGLPSSAAGAAQRGSDRCLWRRRNDPAPCPYTGTAQSARPGHQFR